MLIFFVTTLLCLRQFVISSSLEYHPDNPDKSVALQVLQRIAQCLKHYGSTLAPDTPLGMVWTAGFCSHHRPRNHQICRLQVYGQDREFYDCNLFYLKIALLLETI
jgi:hypothetical protein